MYSQPHPTAPVQSIESSSPTNASRTNSPQEQRPHPVSHHSLNARSCVTCRRRKVKCDKQYPCSNCAKAGSECIFPAPGRAPRKPRQGGKVVSEREAELLKRLRRLEGVVEELSGQVEIEAIKHSPGSENSSGQRDGDSVEPTHQKGEKIRIIGMDEGNGTKKKWMLRAMKIGGGPPKKEFGMEEAQKGVGRLKLEEGKSEYVASPFWAAISDEVEEIRSVLEDQEYDTDSDAPVAPTDAITEPNHQNFIMGYSSSDVDLKALHPLPSQIPFYWQTYLENVQPLVMITHKPTMNKVIKDVQNNLDSLDESTEALMFAIYFATITSMTGSEVRTNFGVEKDVLSRQYRFGVEQALARAGFLNTKEIVTVQAFVLFLVCVRRHDDTRFVWSLTGLALRIAQSLGLHRDGTRFGLSPFDCEMRRRLWWQVVLLDTRASEDFGSDPSIVDFSYDTEYPLSINDDDLKPSATEFPATQPGVSEMTFCLIRFEICALTRKLTYSPPGQTPCEKIGNIMTLEDKERMVRDFSQHFEERYLQHCEDAGPLYWVAATVARLILAKMSLIIYHPLTTPGKPNELSQDIKDRLFMASIEIIEYSRILATEASTKKWGWLFQTYIQWHAIAYMLGELCVRPSSIIVERAWNAIDSVFSVWGLAVSHSKTGMIWQPMRKLMAKARRKREENTRLGLPSNELGIPLKYLRPVPVPYEDRDIDGCPEKRASLESRRLWTHPNASVQVKVSNSMNAGAGIYGTPASSSDAFPISQQQIRTQPESFVQNQNLSQSQQQLPLPNQPLLPDQQGFIQQQQPPQGLMTGDEWLMGGNGEMLDLDMNLEGDVNWDGWDDMVREFQVENDGLGINGVAINSMGDGNMRTGPSVGGMGQWW